MDPIIMATVTATAGQVLALLGLRLAGWLWTKLPPRVRPSVPRPPDHSAPIDVVALSVPDDLAGLAGEASGCLTATAPRVPTGRRD